MSQSHGHQKTTERTSTYLSKTNFVKYSRSFKARKQPNSLLLVWKICMPDKAKLNNTEGGGGGWRPPVLWSVLLSHSCIGWVGGSDQIWTTGNSRCQWYHHQCRDRHHHHLEGWLTDKYHLYCIYYLPFGPHAEQTTSWRVLKRFFTFMSSRGSVVIWK